MTTTLVTPPLTTSAAPPLPRLVGVELRKLADTRGMIATLAAAALAAGAAGGGKALTSSIVEFGEIAKMTLLFAPYFLVGLGAALVTSEITHRTGVTTFTLVPRRGRVLMAKAVAVGLLAVIAAGLGVVAGAMIVVVASGIVHAPVSWAFDAGAFAVVGAGLLTSALIGWALGMATGSMAITLAAFLLWPMVSRLVASFSDSTAHVLDWVQPDAVYGLADNLDVTTLGQTATGLLLWLVVPAIVGCFRLVKGEIR